MEEQTPRQKFEREIEGSYTMQDTFANLLEVGDIRIQSPVMSVKEMVKTTKQLLKNKEVRSYLEHIKSEKVLNAKGYFS